MKVYYDSLDHKCKTPFGAVPTGKEVRFCISVTEAEPVSGVSVCVRRGDKTEYHAMQVAHDEQDGYFCTLTFSEPAIYYYRFEVYLASGKVAFVGVGKYGVAVVGDWLPEWQLTVYDGAYRAPVGFEGGVIYHVFCDRFARDEAVGTAGRSLTPWGNQPRVKDSGGIYRAEEFFGGNLRGITSKLDYIADLGVTLLYLSPIFKAYSNHRYDTGDYFTIDPLLGTEEDFVELCRGAHDRGIKVILDGVFNHTGSDSKYFNKFGNYDGKGAWQGKDSPYYDWYTFGNYPCGYNAWWGIDNVPTVNKDNPDYQRMIYGEGGVIEKWLRLGADGWRLDVADELPSFFIEGIRARLKAVKPDGYLLGEVWEDASVKFSYGTYRPYLLGRELDGVMNYPFGNAVLALAKGGNPEDFVREVNTIMENYPREMLAHSMTVIDTHDTSRAINVLSGVTKPDGLEAQRARLLTQEEYELGKRRLKLASSLQYFLPGMPSLFYGDEAGATGFHDPLSRPCYPWGNEDHDLLEHYKALGRLKKTFKEQFCVGTELSLKNGVLTLARGEDKKIVLTCNLSGNKIDLAGFDLISQQNVTSVDHGEFVVTE